MSYTNRSAVPRIVAGFHLDNGSQFATECFPIADVSAHLILPLESYFEYLPTDSTSDNAATKILIHEYYEHAACHQAALVTHSVAKPWTKSP